ncbi:hypothetical protein Q4530_15375 [Colwellia sp. 1_MG-2023]|uniref:hypothetical protein n=1 Tax=unclassified Colwellia TaxID=196834 RepID=UPI001C083814|nr:MULTISPECIES: hypothetical protein [unclassified Colwellia]MBU2924630.1 hypothetical protein [Colwellia sp. C2M11]MDO6488689.1 hypothetical protein [Colwellia sp. 6_MG-2023]MDO6653886.1 hypothetical protein [Colwellia sp. 3_MG-2023]MDO6666713.1 hypothetical protein [Colwellia sp. 2_MG-2023]MDO6691154.1 hypothetical protein [Colwellia sp. 1_MG-2023]
MFRLYIVILLLSVSAPSFSHSGHDHSDPMAGLIHLLWVAPLVIGIGLIIYQFTKKHRFFNKKK